MDNVEPSCGKKFVLGEDGIVRSDGTTVLGADDFAGVCSILEAVRTVVENKLPHRTIELLFTPAEEVFCGGAEYFDYTRLQAKRLTFLILMMISATAASRPYDY
jgi:tripeptide aminopeptidase